MLIQVFDIMLCSMFSGCFRSASIEPLRASSLQDQTKAVEMFDLVHDIQGLLEKALITGQPGETVASEIYQRLRKFPALLPVAYRWICDETTAE